MDNPVVIIPTYDEKDNVGPIAQAVLAAIPHAHVLFVDDNSPDGTGRILDELAASEPRLHVLHRPGKQGLGRAYLAGFKWALARDYEFVFEMDADFSHSPAELPNFLTAMAGADLVLGSRYIGGIRVMNWPLSRLMISTGASAYVRLVTGLPVRDPTGGFKCFRRCVLEAIDLDRIASNGYSFQIEMTHTAWMMGFRIREIPIVFEDRRAGYSKMSMAIAREAFVMVLRLAARHGFRRSPRMRNAECGARNGESGVRNAERGTRNAASGTRSPEPGTRNAECGARSAECGARSAECGARSAECGARNAESGNRKPES